MWKYLVIAITSRSILVWKCENLLRIHSMGHINLFEIKFKMMLNNTNVLVLKTLI